MPGSTRTLLFAGLALAATVACKGSSEMEAAKAEDTQASKPAPPVDELPEIPPGPVAKVAGKEISREAFIALYRPLIARTGRDDLPRSMKRRFQERVLRRLIHEEQLRLEAASSGVDYDPARLDKQWARRRGIVRDWEEYLKKAAETEESLRQEMLDDLREEALVDSRVNHVITDADIEKAYEEAKPSLTGDRERIRTAHFLLVIAPRTGDEKAKVLPRKELAAASEADRKAWEDAALARAKELRTRALQPGADFKELVRELSEGPGAYRGGDMGYYDDRRMIPAYTKAAMKLKVGEIGEPVLTERGYFVIKMLDRQPPGTIPLEAVREDIAGSVRGRRIRQAATELEQELERKYPSKVLFELTKLNKGKRGETGKD